MKRDLAQLESKEFDLLIVGGGIYGVCAAWDAALRGLSVALIEKNDFGSATSSNSLKIIHGGLRYLQHADLKRMRESITERTNLMRIAPHLVHPLKCVMPTYGHTLRGKEVMAVALLINDLVGFDRNKLDDPGKKLPMGRVISKEACEDMLPGIPDDGLTGGAIWYDCQVHNSERMLISILRSAVEAGAVAANYTEMVDFVMDENGVRGVIAEDALTGQNLQIKAKLVINNTGPWFNKVLARLNGRSVKTEYGLSAAMNLVVRKKLFGDFAVGLWSEKEFEDADAVISKGSRLLFVTPWRGYCLIGTTHVHYEGPPDQFKISESDIMEFVDEVNAAYPPAQLKRDDVLFSYGGLLPSDEQDSDTGDVKLLKSYQIVDHAERDNLEGLLTVVSVKYTTARDVAAKTIDYALAKLGRSGVESVTASTPIFGGDMDSFGDFLESEKKQYDKRISRKQVEHLIRNYGSEYPGVIDYLDEEESWGEPVAGVTDVLAAEVVHAVREEMAVKLADVVRRRTELGSAGYPGDEAVQQCADVMAAELGWSRKKMEQEISETQSLYQSDAATSEMEFAAS